MGKSYNQMIPSIERRLSAWMFIEEKREAAERPPRPTITLSREFGCEGFPLAETLKETLERRTREEWLIYDKALLEKVSADEKLSVQLLSHLGDATQALDTVAFLLPDCLPHHEAFRKIPKYILTIAEKGNAIIVGRGGAIITRQLKNCFHFRLEGSFAFRAASFARRCEISLKEAEETVRDNQKNREKFIADCLHASLSDMQYYHAVFNNEKQGIPAISAAIMAYIAAAWPDADYFSNPEKKRRGSTIQAIR